MKRPCTTSCAEDLFAAIQNKENERVRQILGEEQEPNCVYQHTALIHAVVSHNPIAAAMLLQGSAIDFSTSGQLQAALHAAAIQPNPSVLEALLLGQADPNIANREGLRPIHHAMCVSICNRPSADTGALAEVWCRSLSERQRWRFTFLISPCWAMHNLMHRSLLA